MSAIKVIESVQFVTDGDGRKTAVIVPIEQWKILESLLDKRADFLDEVAEAFTEVKQFKSGELKAQPIENLWDEIPD